MSILYLNSRFRLCILHFNSVEQVADAEEADALSDESKHLHLRQIPPLSKILEGGLDGDEGLEQELQEVIFYHIFFQFFGVAFEKALSRCSIPFLFNVFFLGLYFIHVPILNVFNMSFICQAS